jgi:hypothetical protein
MPRPTEPCPYCGGDESKCDFSFATERCSQCSEPMTGQDLIDWKHDHDRDERKHE